VGGGGGTFTPGTSWSCQVLCSIEPRVILWKHQETKLIGVMHRGWYRNHILNSHSKVQWQAAIGQGQRWQEGMWWNGNSC